MVKSEILYGVLASLIAAIIMLNIPVIASDALIQPKFKADVGYIETEGFTQIKIFNEGWAQAKDVNAIIFLKKEVILNYTVCPEGNITVNSEKQVELDFKRFSTGVNCNIFFNGKINADMDRITVSASDSPGYTWTSENIIEEITSRLFIVFIIEIFTIGASAYLLVKILSRYKTRKNRILKLKTSEKEITEQIFHLENELISKITQQNKDILPDQKNRIRELKEQIQDAKKELVDIRSHIFIEINSDDKLGRFYKNWILLEHEMLKKAKEKSITYSYIPNAGIKVIGRLEEDKLIPLERKEQYLEVRRFRNGIMHGISTASDEELDNQNKIILELIDIIKKI